MGHLLLCCHKVFSLFGTESDKPLAKTLIQTGLACIACKIGWIVNNAMNIHSEVINQKNLKLYSIEGQMKDFPDSDNTTVASCRIKGHTWYILRYQ